MEINQQSAGSIEFQTKHNEYRKFSTNESHFFYLFQSLFNKSTHTYYMVKVRLILVN